MNLVVLPLEGVSQTMVWHHREAMSSVWRLHNTCTSFRRFYNASTSAFQSFCDFVYGDSSELDHNVSYPSAKGCLLGRAENLFGILAENGYATLGIQHGEARPAYVNENFYGAWPNECGEFRWHGGYDGFYAECASFMKEAADAGKPFALYCNDRVGTLADNCSEKRESLLLHERFEKGLSLLDATVARILQILESLSLLDNTLVVVFSPYGMDFWNHGIVSGKSRGTEPYAEMCWAPLFLYCNSDTPQIVEDLACSIDLKATILGILLPERKAAGKRGLFSGLDLQSEKRNIVFSQSLFALERENEGPSKGLVKSYAVTDGELRLIASSDGGIAGDGGMELYYDTHDPYNSRNLLDFFTMNCGGDIVAFSRSDLVHPHFTRTFKPNLVQSLLSSFTALRDSLRQYSKAKETLALGFCTEKSQCQLFSDSQFTFKRRRQ